MYGSASAARLLAIPTFRARGARFAAPRQILQMKRLLSNGSGLFVLVIVVKL